MFALGTDYITLSLPLHKKLCPQGSLYGRLTSPRVMKIIVPPSFVFVCLMAFRATTLFYFPLISNAWRFHFSLKKYRVPSFTSWAPAPTLFR